MKTQRKSIIVQFTVVRVPAFTAKDVKSFRKTLKMTQGMFAAIMGVLFKTAEAWETVANIPLGTARRMFGLLKSDNFISTKYNLIG